MRYVAFVAVLAVCGAASASPRPSEYVPSSPSWDAAPSGAQVQAVYPRGALAAGIAGHALLHCAVEPDATLADCRVVSETPARQGFGPAALRLAAKFRFSMDTVDPREFERLHVDVPVSFTPAAAPAAIDHPQWLHTADPGRAGQVFPARAADAGLATGRAVLECTADAQGMMTGCHVAQEDPPGLDFGPAALRVASAMGINPWTEEGRPADGARVRFTVRLNRQD